MSQDKPDFVQAGDLADNPPSTSIWSAFGDRIETTADGSILLDAETTFESFLTGLGFVFLLFTVVSTGLWFAAATPFWLPFLLGAVAALTLGARDHVDDRYVLDGRQRQVLFQRSRFGKLTRSLVCPFDELNAVVLLSELRSSKTREWREHGLNLGRRNGKPISVLPLTRVAHSQALTDGTALAAHIGVEIQDAHLG